MDKENELNQDPEKQNFGLSNDEEKMISSESSTDPIKNDSTENGETPSSGITIQPPELTQNIEQQGQTNAKTASHDAESLPGDQDSIKLHELKSIEKRYAQPQVSPFNRIFYFFLFVACFFYMMSGWILLAHFSLVPLPGGLKSFVLNLGRFLS